MTTMRPGRRKAGEQAAPPGIALTLTQAARACRVSRAAIQRWTDTGLFPGATRGDGEAGPTVPVADLEAAGLRPRLHLYKRVAAIRILFGAVFAVDAYLKWRPGFASSFHSQVTAAAAAGQPGWLLPWFHPRRRKPLVTRPRHRTPVPPMARTIRIIPARQRRRHRHPQLNAPPAPHMARSPARCEAQAAGPLHP
jgi:hypothetical protein